MKKSKEEIEAELKLAEAMQKLADVINRFTDPIYMQKIFSDAFQTTLNSLPLQPAIERALPAGISIHEITIDISDEQRQQMAEQTFELLKPQIVEFNDFVKNSLLKMPAHRLKDLSEKIKAGAKPHLKQQSGCIFISLDDGSAFYLGL